MDIIGRHFLPDFWQRHPESESTLRGILAIIAAAEWREADDIKSNLDKAVTLRGEGQVVVTDPDGRFLLDLRVNYDRQLIHIIAIHQGDA